MAKREVGKIEPIFRSHHPHVQVSKRGDNSDITPKLPIRYKRILTPGRIHIEC